MPDSGYMDAAAVPDAGDDTLREQLAKAYRAAGSPRTPWTVADALLPRIREHIAAEVETKSVVHECCEVRQTAEAELDRLRSWGGLLELLDEHWPADVFLPPRSVDSAKNTTRRDTGPVILGLIRWVGKLSAEIRNAEAVIERVGAIAFDPDTFSAVERGEIHEEDSASVEYLVPQEAMDYAKNALRDIREALDETKATHG